MPMRGTASIQVLVSQHYSSQLPPIRHMSVSMTSAFPAWFSILNYGPVRRIHIPSNHANAHGLAIHEHTGTVTLCD
jgi:hypothetical protein